MRQPILLTGLRAETLLGFLAALGTLRLIAKEHPEARLSWSQSGSGWTALMYIAPGSLIDATALAGAVHLALEKSKSNHPILNWGRFVSKIFTTEHDFLQASALAGLEDSAGDQSFTPLFTSQVPAEQGDALEHFDHPFRAARRDYYPDNLKSVIESTGLDHIVRTLAAPWDYGDAMANQSLRLDHGDDRRHAYQWHAPTTDPARQKSGCMLGANRLAIEAFPLFPCIASRSGNTAVGFTCESKTRTWVTWPVWDQPYSLAVISNLLNLAAVHQEEPDMATLHRMGIVAVLRSRRLPIEKNKVFLPPVAVASQPST